MSKTIKNKTYHFEVISWDNGIIKIPTDILNELNKDKSLEITISESSINFLQKNKIDKNVFDKIKAVQNLPDDVIINFILAESSLLSNGFKLKNE